MSSHTILIHLVAILFSVAPSWATDTPSAEVVVEGERPSSPDASESSSALTVIPLDESMPIGGDIADALESAAGVRVQRLGGLGSWSTVSIRGATSRQVSVYLDGVPLNPDGASALNLSEMPTTAFERVEVYRGNPPPQFGAAPMGGVVNLVTPDIPSGLGFSATTGSYSTHRLSAFGAGSREVGQTKIDVWTAAEGLQTDGDFGFFQNRSTVFNVFDDSFDVRQNNDKRQLNLLGRLRARKGSESVSFTQGYLDRKEGVPGPAAAQSAGSRLDTRRSLSALTGSTRGSWGRSSLTAWGIFTDEIWDDRDSEVGLGTQWEQSDNQMLGAQSVTDLAFGPSWVGVVSGAIRHDKSVQTNLFNDRADAARNRFSWTASPGVRTQLWDERVQVDGTMFVQGLHNDIQGATPYPEVSGTLSSSDVSLVTAKPRGGVLVRITPGVVAKASWGQYLRPPSFSELFGDRGGVVGNAGLLPETGTTVDGGVRAKIDAPGVVAVVDAAGFSTQTDNKIVFVQNSQRTVRPINVSGAVVRGFEGAVRLELLEFVQSRTSFSRTWSRNLSGLSAYSGNQLPGIPAYELWQQTSVHWDDRFVLGHNYSMTDGEFWDRTNWYRAAPRHLHSAFTRIKPVSRGPELEFELRNLTNQIVETVPRDPLNPNDGNEIITAIDDFNGYPLPGRTWLVSLRWSL